VPVTRFNHINEALVSYLYSSSYSLARQFNLKVLSNSIHKSNNIESRYKFGGSLPRSPNDPFAVWKKERDAEFLEKEYSLISP
jgi:hypothetical protein